MDPLATLEDVKAEPSAAGLTDARIAKLIERASAEFRGDTEQQISLVENDTVTLDGDGSTVLLLPELPVHAVTAVVVDGEPLTEDELKGIWSRRGILRRTDRCTRWPRAGQAIEVTYTHGWDPIPGDIVDVIVQRVLDRAGRRYGLTPASATAGPFTVTYASNNQSEAAAGVSADWARVVSRYKVAQ